ncbi:hypothetical protein B4Q13_16305 [Lacticaseibacillus rhamnosus]
MKAFDVTSPGNVTIDLSHEVENPLINGIEIVTPRHETCAAHMAGTYARLTGKLGVVEFGRVVWDLQTQV